VRFGAGIVLGRDSNFMKSEPFFTHILLRREDLGDGKYPLDIPGVGQIETIRFHPQVTIFAGEKGSGKSTLIEAISIAAASTRVSCPNANSHRTSIAIHPFDTWPDSDELSRKLPLLARRVWTNKKGLARN